MEGVNKASDFYSSIGLSTKSTETKATSEQDQFLQLMIAQLKNQDPFQPMENGEFLSQLAQFDAASGIKELQKSFDLLANSMQSSQALQASGMVGRTVMVPSDVGYLGAHGMNGAVNLEEGADRVVVSVMDGKGQMVGKFDLGPQEAGMVNFAWDGNGLDGKKLPEANYRISAVSWVGSRMEAQQVFASAPVESVTIGQGGRGMTLNLTGIGAWNINDVKQVL